MLQLLLLRLRTWAWYFLFLKLKGGSFVNNTSRVQTREPRLVLIFVHQYIRNMTLTHRAASSDIKIYHNQEAKYRSRYKFHGASLLNVSFRIGIGALHKSYIYMQARTFDVEYIVLITYLYYNKGKRTQWGRFEWNSEMKPNSF